MKKLMLVLATTILAAGTAHPGDSTQAQYRDPSGRISVTVDHVIYVGSHAEPIATRDFSFDLTQEVDRKAAKVKITIDRAVGNYSAHGQSQRLGTRQVKGQSFMMSIGDGGQQLEQSDASKAPLIDLGPPVEGGFSIAGLLADTLPVLPKEALAVGTTWNTERPVRSLEGWAWGNGSLASRHRVTAIDRNGDHTVIRVVTEAEAHLGPLDKERAFTGDLKRTLRWTFDVTDGRLLTMSMEQEAKGSCPLPQGEVDYVQKTRVELVPLDGEATP